MLKGSMTVEMSLLMPLVLLLIMGCMFGVFYYHDKNIINGAAYETAAAGSNKVREKDGIKAGELEQLFQERIGNKCILFSAVQANISVTDDMIIVRAQTAKNSMALSVVKRAAITMPEKWIRDVRRVKQK